MHFTHSKTSLALFSILSLSLSACGPAPISPTPGSSSTPQPTLSPSPNASDSPSPDQPGVVNPSPTPIFSITPAPSSNPNAGSTTSISLPNGSRLVLTLANRFLNKKGQSVQLKAQLFDAAGNTLPLSDLKLLFSSSRPSDLSISDDGLVIALKSSGFSQLSVRIEGTDLVATQLISVNDYIDEGGVSSGGGNGGGGGNPQPTPTPSPSASPSSQVDANLGFEGLGLGQFAVSKDQGRDKTHVRVAMDDSGNSVVTWQGSNIYSYYGKEIYAQRYNAAGIPQGPEIAVNTYTQNNQTEPAVAMDSDGDFVITWQSNHNYSSDIYARRYNAAGVAQDDNEFPVSTYSGSGSTLGKPAVAMDNSGKFVVSWQSNQSGTNDIYAQLYTTTNGEAVKVATEKLINTYATTAQTEPTVAMDNSGKFVVAWQSDHSGTNDVYARRYDAAGGDVDSHEFAVNASTSTSGGSQSKPAVAMDENGNFMIAWQSDQSGASTDDIYARRYPAAGETTYNEFRVNTYTSSMQTLPAIAMANSGQFVVSWQSWAQDGSGEGVYAQRYTATAGISGNEFRVNTTTTGSQTNPAVAIDAVHGDFMVVWQHGGIAIGSLPPISELENGIYAKYYKANGMVK